LQQHAEVSLHFGVPGFNPCRVFSGLATREGKVTKSPSPPCFNPCRVFSGLATQETRTERRWYLGFNPCRVFSGLATWLALHRRNREPCFNPCRVFSGLATHLNKTGQSWRSDMFQSLSGFFRPCNLEADSVAAAAQEVSIPVGFFQALQRIFSGWHLLDEAHVSIPVGFFQALQLCRSRTLLLRYS